MQYEQDYSGGIEYRKTPAAGTFRIEAIYHEEGRYFNLNVDASNTPSWRKEYALRDHLGNTRLMFADKDGDGMVEVTSNASTNEILQENHYYPFGLSYGGSHWMNDAARDNGYKYNGKELNEDWGLGWYDYGARWYMPDLGRWGAVDPLAEEMASWSSYSYALNNPIQFVDPDGMAPMIAGPGDPPGAGRYQASVNTRYIGFGIRHPLASLRIGFGVTKGATDISTNATRFATRGEVLHGSKRNQDDRGSENGAFRHVLWQASITTEFGESVAAQAGNAHEENAFADLSNRTFSNLGDADETVDLLNNQIGRAIGNRSSGADMLNLANMVLNEFHFNGLFTASKDQNGNFVVSKTTLSKEKYSELKEIFSGLNFNGRTPAEQKSVDEKDKRLQEATTISKGPKL